MIPYWILKKRLQKEHKFWRRQMNTDFKRGALEAFRTLERIIAEVNDETVKSYDMPWELPKPERMYRACRSALNRLNEGSRKGALKCLKKVLERKDQ